MSIGLLRPITIYLSGPMSGQVSENRLAFAAAAGRLRTAGYAVLNPAENDGGSSDKPREFYMRMDMDNVMRADEVHVLPGWQGSSGARLEVQLGRALGLPIKNAADGTPADLGIFDTGGHGDPRFHALLRQIADLHDKKQADYGAPKDPFSNVRASEEWGVQPWVGAMVRLNDKVRRLQSFARKGVLANESAEDSLMDIAVYSLIALILYREVKP